MDGLYLFGRIAVIGLFFVPACSNGETSNTDRALQCWTSIVKAREFNERYSAPDEDQESESSDNSSELAWRDRAIASGKRAGKSPSAVQAAMQDDVDAMVKQLGDVPNVSEIQAAASKILPESIACKIELLKQGR